jgi:hypothetical protein
VLIALTLGSNWIYTQHSALCYKLAQGDRFSRIKEAAEERLFACSTSGERYLDYSSFPLTDFPMPQNFCNSRHPIFQVAAKGTKRQIQ